MKLKPHYCKDRTVRIRAMRGLDPLYKLNWQIDYSLPISDSKGVLIVFASNGVLGWCQRQFNGIKNLFEWFKNATTPLLELSHLNTYISRRRIFFFSKR